MARLELPQRLKSRRRRRRLIGVGIIVVIIVAVIAALAGISHAPFLRITTVNVSGAKTIATSTVEAAVRQAIDGSYWYLFAKDDILLYPNKQIVSSLIARYPTIKNVEVHAVDFHTIAVTIVEREPKAQWCDVGCFVMDESGVVYAPLSLDASSLVVYQGKATGTKLPKQYLSVEQFRSLASLIEALIQTTPDDPIRQVVVDENGDVRAYYQKDFLLMFTLSEANGDVFERYGLVMKSDPFTQHKLEDFEYLDLRFGDKLYYKLK
jgi:cell division septal protein FtsQ